MNAPWYVAQTKPRQESVALENLLRQGYQAYLPKLKVVRRVRNRYVAKLEPMFPAYVMFCPASERQSIAPVRSTLGVTRIVSFGQQPAILRDETIQQIRDLEAGQLEARLDEISPIQPGTAVRVVSGPFAGLEGLVSEITSKRVEVLMHLMGKDTRVGLPVDSLTLAN